MTTAFSKLLNFARWFGTPALKAYAIFAILNVAYKIALSQFGRLRAKKIWEHVPGNEIDPLGREFRGRIHEFHDYFKDVCLEHPTAPLIKTDLPMPLLMCNTPESLKWMLKDEFANVTKSGGDDYLMELMGEFLGKNGIFVLQHGTSYKQSNEQWNKQRKVASLIFTKSNFQTVFYDTFVEKAHKVVNRLAQNEGKPLDLQEVFFSFTMDSIEKFFMGTEVNTVEGGMSEYARTFDKAHQEMIQIYLKGIMVELSTRLALPFPFGTLFISQSLNSTIGAKLFQFFDPKTREFRKSVKRLDQHVKKYIASTRKDPNLKQRKDIIANFLNSSIGSELSDNDLRDIVLSLTIAGRDTTACALSWMFYELTQNEEVQEQLLKEIDEKLEGRVPTMSDLEADSMPFLNGVIYEALRLHPPVPTESKRAEKDIQYLDGTIVPAGTKLMFSIYGMGRNPTRYPDPLKFDPTRWIPFKQPNLYEFPVFQAGPRFCLGKDMAQFEMKLLSVMMLQKFRFSLLQGEQSKIWYSMMLTQSISNHKDRETHNLWAIPHRR